MKRDDAYRNLVVAAARVLEAACIGTGYIICPKAFLEPIRGLADAICALPDEDTKDIIRKSQDPRRKMVRLSLETATELNQTLEELASKTPQDKSTVLRKAIKLMEVAMGADIPKEEKPP